MPDLKINVDVTGAQKGAADMNALASATTKTAQAAEKTAPANQKAATATKSLGDALSGLGSRNNDAKDVLEGVSAAAKGGEGALFGVAKAARAVFAVFASGPIGIAVAGLALLGTALLALADKFRAPKKSAEEFAQEVQKATAEAARLNALKFEGLKSELTAIDEGAKQATLSFELLQKKAEQIDQATEALELARVANNTGLSDEARAQQEAQIRQQFADRKQAREVGADQFSVNLAQRRAGEKSAVESSAAEDFVRAQQALANLPDPDALREQIRQIQERQEAPVFQTKEERSRDSFFKQEAEQSLAEATSERGKARRAAAQDELAAAEARFLTANEAAIKALNDRVAAEQKASVAQETRAAVKPIEAQRREIETGKASAEARAKDAARQKQLDELAQRSRDQQAAGDFAGQDETVAEIKKLEKRDATPVFTPQKISTFAPKEKSPGLTQTAQQIQSQPPLDADPMAQEVKALAENVSAKTTQGQASLDAAASTIAAATQAVTPPFDTSVLIENFGAFAQANQATHTATNARLTELASYVQSLAQMQQMQAQQIQSAANASR